MNEDIINEAKEFLTFVVSQDSHNRADALIDLKFRYGDQWPVELMNSRQMEQRPCLTINKIDSFCRTVENQQRQQRPRIQVHPTTTQATKKIADVVQGLIRHIETKSSAETAYDTGFSHAITMGRGYWKVTGGYSSPDVMEQDLSVETIDNPFSVYFDSNSVLPDGSDAKKAMITVLMSKEAFRQEYPEAQDMQGWQAHGSGDGALEWVTKHDIRVAEYYCIEDTPDMLYKLSDGTTVYKKDLPTPEEMAASNRMIVKERKSWKRELHWYKLTALEVLEHRILPGKYIPIVPVYGNVVIHDGKRQIFGMVKFAKDPQKMVNFWETAATESLALAPKAKWLMAEGQDEDHENEWAKANMSANPVLRYKQTDVNGQEAPPPQRLQPEPPPEGMLNALQTATNNMREVLGITDPAMRDQGNVSGKALNGQQVQSDIATYHYYDNLTRSIAHTGRILLDLIPFYYDTERTVRIIGDDGQPNLITINGKQTTAEGEVIHNNLCVGEYDVIMDTGPGYNSKRQEAVEAIAPLMNNKELFQVIADLYFRNSDFPGADVIADRLAAMNPMAQTDKISDIPQSAQIKMKQMQQQIQMLSQQLQAATQEIKQKQGIEQMRQQAETEREKMRGAIKLHDIETRDAQTQRDVEMETHTQAHETAMDYKKAMDVEKLKANVALLLAHMDNDSEASKVKTGAENSADGGFRTHPDYPGFKIRKK